MGITLQWDNEQRTIIRQTFTPGWTWDEFYETNAKQVRAMMGEVSHTVSIISDFRDSGPLPVGGGAVSQAYNAMRYLPANSGIVVVVSNNGFIQALVNIFKHVYVGNVGRKTFVVGTIEEAYHCVRNEAKS